MPSDVIPMPKVVQRLGERANPILVKEVRSALRGKAFGIGFTIVLVLALIVSTSALIISSIDGDAPSGEGYLVAVTIVFALGAYGLVPFAAMASMGAEHDDGALELLQLSGVSPGRLVAGKLGAAAVQAGLIYAAFLPFLSFAFLLEGVDLLQLAGGIVGSFCGSIAFSALGILFGAAMRARWQRVLAYVALAVCLMIGVQTILFVTMAGSLFGLGGSRGGDLLLTLSIMGLFGALCCVLATSRLQHREENRSTAFRVLGTAGLVVFAGFGVASGDTDATTAWLIAALAVATPSLFMAVGEPERMPRAVLARVKKRGLPFYLAPWMPGGGRGVLLVMVNTGLVLGAAVLAAIVAGGSRTDWWRMVASMAVIEAWFVLVLLLPPGILARWLDRGWARTLALIAICVLPAVLMLVPALIQFLLGDVANPFDHAGNPAHFSVDLYEHGVVNDPVGLAVFLASFLLALGLNVPRAVRSFSELRRAREQVVSTLPEARDAATGI